MRILVLHPPRNDMFHCMSKACCESFKSLGHEVGYAKEYREGYDIAFSAVFYHPWKFPRDSTIKVGYHLEQLPWGCQNKTLMGWYKRFITQQHLYDYIVDGSIKNRDWLQENGYKNVLWCALGYHKVFENLVQQETCPPVRFTGFRRERRRRKVLRYIDHALKAHVMDIDYSSVGFTGIGEAKIHLNIHNYEQGSFESYRVIRLMCNRQFVLTEGTSEHHPFKNGMHWAEVDWHHIPNAIMHYLEKDQKRHRIIEDCYNYIRNKYDFTNHLQKMLHEIITKRG